MILRDTARSVKDKHNISVHQFLIVPLTNFVPVRVDYGVDFRANDRVYDSNWATASSKAGILKATTHATGTSLKMETGVRDNY